MHSLFNPNPDGSGRTNYSFPFSAIFMSISKSNNLFKKDFFLPAPAQVSIHLPAPA
jgi:hypothetical protein